MNKSGKKDLAAKLAMECECFGSKSKAEDIIAAMFTTIANEVTMGTEVAIPGFGKFMIVERAARMGVNPQTGAQIKIPASKTVKFKVSKTLKDACNN